MAVNLTESSNFDANVSVPEDGDDRNAASVEVPFQALTNRSRWLYNTLTAVKALTDVLYTAAHTWAGTSRFDGAVTLGPGVSPTYSEPRSFTRTVYPEPQKTWGWESVAGDGISTTTPHEIWRYQLPLPPGATLTGLAVVGNQTSTIDASAHNNLRLYLIRMTVVAGDPNTIQGYDGPWATPVQNDWYAMSAGVLAHVVIADSMYVAEVRAASNAGSGESQFCTLQYTYTMTTATHT